MAISFIAVSANFEVTSAVNLTVTPPVTQTDDIMILALSGTGGGSGAANATAAGFTTIAFQAGAFGSGGAAVQWKRCVGAEPAFTVVNTFANGIVATVAVYRGCRNIGSPINVQTAGGFETESASPYNVASVVTTVDNCVLLFTMHGLNVSGGPSSAQSSANFGVMTERFDNVAVLGANKSCSLADVVIGPGHGATGASTGTMTPGGGHAVVAALEPALPITFVAASAAIAQVASGNLTVTPPATITGDIIVCSVTARTAGTITFPAGWTIYENSQQATGRATSAWKRCVGAEAAFVITSTHTNGTIAGVSVYRGCKLVGSPVNVSILTVNVSSTTCTANTITPSVANCMLVFSAHKLNNNGAAGAQTSANFGLMAERFDYSSTVGSVRSVSCASVPLETATATGNSTATLTLAAVNVGINTALEPEPAPAGAAIKQLALLGVG